jgi:hypothetical protein
MSKWVIEPISDIYVSRTFQWYKKRMHPMSFDFCNRPLKIWKSILDFNSQNGSSYSFAFPGAWDVTLGIPFWPASFQTFALVANLRLGLRHHKHLMWIKRHVKNDVRKKIVMQYWWNILSKIICFFSLRIAQMGVCMSPPLREKTIIATSSGPRR